MDTVIVASSQFYSHYPKRIPKGTVNAEHVEIRLDSEWDNLTVRIHWLNVASGVEKVVLLELDQPNTIPWEVLTDLGELRMGLVGLDGETVIKPTIWLTYGYVTDGVDPESGSDPQPPTPSWEQQMVEQATQANKAAQAAQKAAEEAAKSVASAGPYADEAKKSAEAAKASQDAANTSAKQAANAKDQANIASDTAKDHADAAGTAKVAAERAAETAGNAQSGAALSAQTAANSAKEAETAKQEAQKAASIFPQITQEDAGKFLMVNPEGNGYIFGKAGGGKINDSVLGKDTTWSSRMILDSLAPAFEESGPVVTCNPVPGYPLSVVSQITQVQDGNGDPSPDNVRPIVGWGAGDLYFRGINLFDKTAAKIKTTFSWAATPGTPVSFGTYEGAKPYCVFVVPFKPGQSAYFYNQQFQKFWLDRIVTYNTRTELAYENFRLYDDGKNYESYSFKVGSYQIDSLLVRFKKVDGTEFTQDDVDALTTVIGIGGLRTEISPYTGENISIDFGQTVYGGQLNWTTGTLMVDRVCLSLTGEENFVNATASDGITRFYALKNLNPAAMGMFDPGETGEIYSMVGCKSPYDNADENIAQIASLGNTNELRIRLSLDLDDAGKFKAELARLNEAGTPFQVSYRIAEPFTIQLTPTEILAISSVNTLYTDTGDITVSGRADPNEVIKGLEGRIAALQGGGGGTMDAQQVLFSRALAATCTTFSDAEAQSMPDILPTWQEFLDRKMDIKSGVCLMHDGQCYRQNQSVPIKPEAHRPPGSPGMSAVYRPVVSGHAGTLDDPIPWVYEMDCEAGKYYSHKGKIYLCTGNMSPCVWEPGGGAPQWEEVA